MFRSVCARAFVREEPTPPNFLLGSGFLWFLECSSAASARAAGTVPSAAVTSAFCPELFPRTSGIRFSKPSLVEEACVYTLSCCCLRCLFYDQTQRRGKSRKIQSEGSSLLLSADRASIIDFPSCGKPAIDSRGCAMFVP